MTDIMREEGEQESSDETSPSPKRLKLDPVSEETNELVEKAFTSTATLPGTAAKLKTLS